MISLLHLNKLSQFTIFFTILIFNSVFAATAVDIWKKNEKQNDQVDQAEDKEEITIESPILSEDLEKITIKIEEQEIRCPIHLSVGQEAVAVGAIEKLLVNDTVFSNHRAHAHYLAKGGNLNKMFAEFF